MKKKVIADVIHGVVLVLGVMTWSACSGDKKVPRRDTAVVNIDSNLTHLLQPVNEQVVATLPVIKAEYGTRIITEELQGLINYDSRNQTQLASRVSGRIERLFIKYNYQSVRKGQVIMEVYAPDLTAAQQELLFLRQTGDAGLFEGAKQRLLLLGMNAATVNEVLKTGKVNYRIPVYSPASGYIMEKTDVSINSPVLLREGQYVSAGQPLFDIYGNNSLVAEFSLKPGLAARVKKGDQLLFYPTANKDELKKATIGLIEPVFKGGQNFAVARVYLRGATYTVGQQLTAKIAVLVKASWWLPEIAVVKLGNRSVVFKKEGKVLMPIVVKTGLTIGGMVQILEDISTWEVSKNAAYLIDSESFINLTQQEGGRP